MKHLILGIALAGLVAASADAFPRRVMWEEFTGHG